MTLEEALDKIMNDIGYVAVVGKTTTDAGVVIQDVKIHRGHEE